MSHTGRVDETQEELDPRRVRSRDRLLDAATELLTTGGIEAVTVEAVVQRSKVARTTLYRNFGNITELLAAAFERLIPPVESAPETGSLRDRLVELLGRKTAAIQQAPVETVLLAWLGMTPRALEDSSAPDAGFPAVHSLRTRLLEHHHESFNRIFHSPEGRTELGELDSALAVAQLLGPLFFLRLTGLRPVTPADHERIVDDFLAGHRQRSQARDRSSQT